MLKSEPETPIAAQLPHRQRPEDELLLACSSRCMSHAAVARAREYFEPEIDWNYIVSQAQHHAVLPLVNQNLQLHFPGLVPKRVLEFLNEASRLCQRRNLVFTGELLRILALFENMGIEAIPFKGPALAIAAYGNVSLRMFADLDILVRHEELARARDALLADGYVAEFAFTPSQERNYQNSECALKLRHPRRCAVVELHWLLTERYLSIDFPMAAIWQRSSTAKIGTKTVKALAPEDLLVYLCVHGSKHQWERLEWLRCVAEFAASNPHMNWPAVGARARAWGIQRMLNMALLLAHDLLAMPVPEALRRGVENDLAARRLAEQAASDFFSRRTAKEQVSRGDWYLGLLRMRERWPDKIRMLAYSSVRLPHPCSQEFLTLPSKLAFLYYILRPARLLGASLWAGLRRVAPGRKRAKNSDRRTLVKGQSQGVFEGAHTDASGV